MKDEKLLTLLQEWRNDPVRFVEEALKAKPFQWQREALRALQEKRKVSIRSGHGVGKSTTLAWAALWFISTHFPCKIPCTAPTGHQLEDVLWAEIDKWHRKLPKALREQFTLNSDRLFLTASPNESFAVARTSRAEQPEALQGFHSENILFLIDEASGIPDKVFEVAEGALSTTNSHIIMGANPTRTQGYFFDSHTRTRHLWHTMRVSCLDVPEAVSPDYIESQAIRYGEDSNVYRVRVLGEFPTGDDDAVVPLHLVVDSVNRDVDVPEDEPIVWGVDVARFGDDRSALCKRQGRKVMEPIKTWRNKNLMQLSGIITQMYNETPTNERPDDIMVDVIGVGAGVVDRLRENGLPVRAVNVSESAAMSSRFFRLRDELYWAMRDFFEERGGSIPDQDELVQEITQPRYELLGSGKIKVETKADVKKRTLMNQSPDLSDAFMLTFASSKVRGRAWGRIEYPEAGVV